MGKININSLTTVELLSFYKKTVPQDSWSRSDGFCINCPSKIREIRTYLKMLQNKNMTNKYSFKIKDNAIDLSRVANWKKHSENRFVNADTLTDNLVLFLVKSNKNFLKLFNKEDEILKELEEPIEEVVENKTKSKAKETIKK